MSLTMTPIISIENLNKQYSNGLTALNNVNLSIESGEIFALLGPNGAGKTTLINLICGINKLSSGRITIDGFDNQTQYREARKLIGLVPQELATDMFVRVIDAVKLSRGLFGLKPNDAYIESLLKQLSLWDKKDSPIMTLSGGMKRRVLIAKALSHEPKILFLDEPTAGVDVELRKAMWSQIHELRKSGVTIILTTHYIEEAEEMADRIGIIQKGTIILVENKDSLIQKLGKKRLIIELDTPLEKLPESLSAFYITLAYKQLIYHGPINDNSPQLSDLFRVLSDHKITYTDIISKTSSLEDIFVELVKEPQS